MPQAPFDDMYTNLFHKLHSNHQMAHVTIQFIKEKNVYNMLNYFWKMEEFHEIIIIKQLVKGKSNKDSEELRRKGNSAYKSGLDTTTALRYYNLCMQFSATPESLSLGYANRSACFYVLNLFDECLHDIAMAFANAYPTDLLHKLVERKAKCYLAKNDLEKAASVLDEYNLKNKILPNTKIKPLSFKAVQKQYLQEKSEGTAPLWLPQVINSHKYLDIPVLKNINPSIRSLSDAVQIAYTPEKGRYLVAKRDIVPGEVVIKEKSYSAIVLPNSVSSHCSNCLKYSPNSIPCSSCCNVVFCNEECSREAHKRFHGMECALLSSLLALDFGTGAMLSLRLVVQQISEGSEKLFDKYERESEFLTADKLGFDPLGNYNSSDYRTVFHLMTNEALRNPSDLFKKCIMSLALLKLLLTADTFKAIQFKVGKNIPDDLLPVAKALFRHVMNMPCNSHSIVEFVDDVSDYGHLEGVGAGIFSVISLSNHSCNASLSRSSYGTTAIERAIQFIAKGTELTSSYGEHFARQDYYERQSNLKKQFYFSCTCEACTSSWPIHPYINTKVEIKCPNCERPLNLQTSVCSQCAVTLSSLKFTIRGDTEVGVKQLYEIIFSAIEKYVKSYNNIRFRHKYEIFESVDEIDIENLKFLLELLSKYVNLPSRCLLDVQNSLQFCFDFSGPFCKCLRDLPSPPPPY